MEASEATVVRRGAQAMYKQTWARRDSPRERRGWRPGKTDCLKQQNNCPNPTQAVLYSNGEISRCLRLPVDDFAVVVDGGVRRGHLVGRVLVRLLRRSLHSHT